MHSGSSVRCAFQNTGPKVLSYVKIEFPFRHKLAIIKNQAQPTFYGGSPVIIRDIALGSFYFTVNILIFSGLQKLHAVACSYSVGSGLYELLCKLGSADPTAGLDLCLAFYGILHYLYILNCSSACGEAG